MKKVLLPGTSHEGRTQCCLPTKQTHFQPNEHTVFFHDVKKYQLFYKASNNLQHYQVLASLASNNLCSSSSEL